MVNAPIKQRQELFLGKDLFSWIYSPLIKVPSKSTNRCSSFEAISVFQELGMSSSHGFCFGHSLVHNPLYTCYKSAVSSSPDVKVAAKGNLGAATARFNDRANDRTGNDRII